MSQLQIRLTYKYVFAYLHTEIFPVISRVQIVSGELYVACLHITVNFNLLASKFYI
jgi:hypothetical protein